MRTLSFILMTKKLRKNWLSQIDVPFISIIFSLTVLSLLNFYSITHTSSAELSSLFWTQSLWILIGFIIFLICSFSNYLFFIRLGYIIYGLNLLALVMVLFFGKSSNGSTRWLDLGLFNYQPSETMKVSLILMLVFLFSSKSTLRAYSFKDLVLPISLTIIPMVLITYQPDLGTSLVIGLQACLFLFFIKMTRPLMSTLIALLIVIAPLMWIFILKDYQKSRIITFISASADPQGAGYHAIQSKIAIGSGQLFGKGFRKGTQAQLEFLPERHTDFAFSVFSEEYGLAGSMLVISLFVFLFARILQIAVKARGKIGFYLCIGCLSLLFWHIIINLSMTVGLLPVVGIPLPLFSYGGSHMLTIFTTLGLISSVSSRRYIYSS